MTPFTFDKAYKAEIQAAQVYGFDEPSWIKLCDRIIVGVSPSPTPGELELFDKIFELACLIREDKIKVV